MPSTDTALCRYCGGTFAAARRGAHVKEFCRPSCRTRFHTAARKLGEQIASTWAPGLMKLVHEQQNIEYSSCTTPEARVATSLAPRDRAAE